MNGTPRTHAADPPGDSRSRAPTRCAWTTPPKNRSRAALEWLAGKQNVEAPGARQVPAQHRHHLLRAVGVPVAGHLPQQGQYGPEVSRGCRFLLSSAGRRYLIGSRGGNMYCHAMATLALAELWGMTGDDDIKPVLTKAVELIVRCQNPEGGWRYDRNRPGPTFPSPSCK